MSPETNANGPVARTCIPFWLVATPHGDGGPGPVHRTPVPSPVLDDSSQHLGRRPTPSPAVPARPLAPRALLPEHPCRHVVLVMEWEPCPNNPYRSGEWCILEMIIWDVPRERCSEFKKKSEQCRAVPVSCLWVVIGIGMEWNQVPIRINCQIKAEVSS
jgi:hypothetical protein